MEFLAYFLVLNEVFSPLVEFLMTSHGFFSKFSDTFCGFFTARQVFELICSFGDKKVVFENSFEIFSFSMFQIEMFSCVKFLACEINARNVFFI